MKYDIFIVNKKDTILSVLKVMDSVNRKLLIVADGDDFQGVISIGDIQRAIIRNISLTEPISKILRNDIFFAKIDDDKEMIKLRMKERRIEMMPVVSQSSKLVDVILWEDIISESLNEQGKETIDLPVVIMAGGFGTRLKPLTNVLPKPLIPIGEKTILEEIISRFEQYKCKNFYISVNYKSELIQYYFSGLNLKSEINFFQENRPMGTAGSLSLLKDKISETFFVTNCDILIEQDYAEILKYHRDNNNDITIVAALKHIPVAYGTIETGENGLLKTITEKPEFIFKINSGMYILEPSVLDNVPDDKFYHITHLIDDLNLKGGRVGVFPISEKSWIDIGEWREYIVNSGIKI